MNRREPVPPPTSFRTPAAFRAWLARNHAKKTELVLRCFKKHAANRGVTYAQSLDEALSFGWIDGIRRGVDDDSFSVRFTPRKPRSTWSRVNIAHVKRLTEDGRMQQAGLTAFAARTEERTGAYSFERQTALATAYARIFRANRAGWAYYQSRAPWYRRTTAHWIMSAKREDTRAKRLAVLIACSARGTTIPQLARG